jgi:hypothetical protein
VFLTNSPLWNVQVPETPGAGGIDSGNDIAGGGQNAAQIVGG